MIDKIIKLRRELHQFPELSGNEYQTAARIRRFINRHHPTTILDKLGGAGFAAIYEFGGIGPTIAVRCELDALPITEQNDLPYNSKVEGVSHKCGHDAHMSIVAGLIFWLKKQRFNAGKVILLFQSAEETGKGAFHMMSDPRMDDLAIDFIFALHNIPGEPLHRIIMTDKGFSAEVISFSLALVGKESHASEPENGINPAHGLSRLVNQFSRLEVNHPNDEHFALLTPVHITLGQKSYGVSPARAELHYTIRTWSTTAMKQLRNEIDKRVSQICQEDQLKFEFQWFEHFAATVNDPKCNQYILKAAKGKGLETYQRPTPFKFGEDFGWFSQKYKGAMFGLGAGVHAPALHHANYDYPDEITATGIRVFTEIIQQIMLGH